MITLAINKYSYKDERKRKMLKRLSKAGKATLKLRDKELYYYELTDAQYQDFKSRMRQLKRRF